MAKSFFSKVVAKKISSLSSPTQRPVAVKMPPSRDKTFERALESGFNRYYNKYITTTPCFHYKIAKTISCNYLANAPTENRKQNN